MTTENTTMTTKQQIAREILPLLEKNRRSRQRLKIPYNYDVVDHRNNIIVPNERKIAATIEPHLDLFDADEKATITSFLEYMHQLEWEISQGLGPISISMYKFPSTFEYLMRGLAKKD